MVPHLLRSGVGHLIDEMYLEVHTNINSCCKGRSDRQWSHAMDIIERLRAAGVYAHDWG